jgi:AcrR family transcriptional regulator
VTDQPVRPGRKRSEESRRAILAAAIELTAESGYAALTIEGIAARSGAGKQTIYRWWRSKADVLLDALALKADLHIPVPDEGSYEEDLRAFLAATFVLGSRAKVMGPLRALMAEAQIDAEFGERFREEFMRQRRAALGVLVERARDRGELPDGVPPELVVDVVFGTLWYRILAAHRPVDQDLIDQLVTLLTRRRP